MRMTEDESERARAMQKAEKEQTAKLKMLRNNRIISKLRKAESEEDIARIFERNNVTGYNDKIVFLQNAHGVPSHYNLEYCRLPLPERYSWDCNELLTKEDIDGK